MSEQLAQRFHETYERLAPSFGYETRRESAKPWADVPEQNRALMAAVCAEIIATGWLDPTAAEQLRAERDEAIGEKDAAIRNWIGVQDAWERLLPVVEAAKAWRATRNPDREKWGASIVRSTSAALAAAVDALEEEGSLRDRGHRPA